MIEREGSRAPKTLILDKARGTSRPLKWVGEQEVHDRGGFQTREMPEGDKRGEGPKEVATEEGRLQGRDRPVIFAEAILPPIIAEKIVQSGNALSVAVQST